jgi:Raf kinase inhibitor-like YbhB/YbcL family protein
LQGFYFPGIYPAENTLPAGENRGNRHPGKIIYFSHASFSRTGQGIHAKRVYFRGTLFGILTEKIKRMKITSPLFRNGERVPVKYTCEGPNVSPPLEFSEIPDAARSLVLMVEDPDAEAKPWVHWLVYNIPPRSGGFRENSIPEGAVQGICNGGTYGYEGPCPPEGRHDYDFRLYALDILLDIAETSDRKAVLEAMKNHVIAEAVLTGVYEKEKVEK